MLNSITSQMTENIELILVNDGSTDDSLTICKEYQKKYKNVIVESIQNSGSGIARNKGIEIAKGEYLYFPDSDDLLCEGSIKIVLESILDNPDYIVYSYYQSYRNNNINQLIKLKDTTLNANDIRKNYEKCLIPSSDVYLQGAPWNKVFKKEIIEKNSLKFPTLKRHQDDAFIISYVGYVDKIKIVSKPIYIYFQNLSYDESLKFPKNYFEIRKQLYNIFIENLNKWNSSELSKNYVAFSFALCLKRIFMLTYSDKWEFTLKQRKEYFNKILEDETINKVLESLKCSYEDVINIIPKLSKKKKILYKLYIKILLKKRKRTLKILTFLLYKLGNNSLILKIRN